MSAIPGLDGIGNSLLELVCPHDWQEGTRMRSHFPFAGKPGNFSLPVPRPLLALLAVFCVAVVLSGCGGSSSQTVQPGATTVVVMASSTANDALVALPLTLQSLTLKSQSGNTVTVFSTPIGAEYIHLNGNPQPLVTTSIPQDTYVSAFAVFGGASPTCVGLHLVNSALISGSTPVVTVNLPQPIQVTGTAMAIDLDLDVSQSFQFAGGCTLGVSAPLNPTFTLTTMDIAAQPTNSTNGRSVGMDGVITAVNAANGTFTANGLGQPAGPGAVWQASINGSTVFSGVNNLSGLSAGLPVDMDISLQPDGSLLATRVAVIDTNTANVDILNGEVLYQGDRPSSLLALSNLAAGAVSENFASVGYAQAASQISSQFPNVKNLPFPAVFQAASATLGQNLLVAANISSAAEFSTNSFPATTVELVPQTINGTVTAVSASGGFTVYTVTLAPYDLFPILAAANAGQSGVPTAPNTVQVYADSSTAVLTPVSTGSVFRFYGLVFNDNGTLRMDCAQIAAGVAE